MSNEQLVLLIRHGASEHIEELYRRNIGLINKAASYFSQRAEADDLRQEAYFYLLQAVELWDPDQNTSFSTYLFSVLRYNMRKYVYEQNAVHIPANLIMLVNRYEKACADFLRDFGRKPTARELMLLLKMDKSQLSQIKKVAAAMAPIKSLDAPVTAENDVLLQEVIPDRSNALEEVEDNIDREAVGSILWEIVDALGQEEAAAIRCKYVDGLTLAAAAEKLNLSVAETRRATDRAMHKLRAGKLRTKLRSLYFEIYGDCIQRSSLGYFLNTNTSGTEYTAMKLVERECNRKARDLEVRVP